MKNVKVKIFDDYQNDPVKDINEFIEDKEVVDIKQDMVVITASNLYTQYLVIYREETL